MAEILNETQNSLRHTLLSTLPDCLATFVKNRFFFSALHIVRTANNVPNIQPIRFSMKPLFVRCLFQNYFRFFGDCNQKGPRFVLIC